jgi:hypothetical protein
MCVGGGYLKVNTNESNQLERLFYMSKDMMYRMAAFGQVLVIDTTAKTNRFDMYLFLASVMDNRSKSSIVCMCFIRTETAVDFGWIMEQMTLAMTAISYDITKIVHCILSDEDKGMSAAINDRIPQVNSNQI